MRKREIQNEMFLAFLVFLFFAFWSVFGYLSYINRNETEAHKPLVSILEINQTPEEFAASGCELFNVTNLSLLSEEERHIKFRYVFLSKEGEKLPVSAYKGAHPEDKVFLTRVGAESPDWSPRRPGGRSLVVFSNSLPDSDFFRVIDPEGGG